MCASLKKNTKELVWSTHEIPPHYVRTWLIHEIVLLGNAIYCNEVMSVGKSIFFKFKITLMKAQSAEKHMGCLYILLFFLCHFIKNWWPFFILHSFVLMFTNKQVYLIGSHLQQFHANDSFKSSTSRNSSIRFYRTWQIWNKISIGAWKNRKAWGIGFKERHFQSKLVLSRITLRSFASLKFSLSHATHNHLTKSLSVVFSSFSKAVGFDFCFGITNAY